MELPDIEGIRLALLDPQSRLRRMSEGPPGADYPRIRRLTIQGTDFFEDFDISLNPCLNTLIGGRGSGKSTVIECLRFALDRAQERDFDEDEEEIRKMVEDFLREKPLRDYGETKGMLLPDYNITAEVIIAGKVYRIIRSSRGKEVIRDPDLSISPQPLDIRTLIIPRILSQRQIARIARDSAAQRRELDALCPREETQAFEEKRKAFLYEIEQLQIVRRKLKEQRAKLPSTITELQTIKDQISFLEQGGNKEILERYRTFQAEKIWLEDTLGSFQGALDSFNDQERLLSQIKEKIGPPPEGSNKLWMEEIAEKVKGSIYTAIADLGKIRNEMQSLLETLRHEQTKKWKPGFDKTVDAYRQLEKDLKEKGIQFVQHERLLQQRAFLEKEIKKLQGIENELREIENELRNKRECLIVLHEDRLKKRRMVAENLEREDADVRLEIVPFGDQNHLASQREVWFAGAGLQIRDWEIIIDFIYSQENGIIDRLHQIVDSIRRDIEITEKEGKTIGTESSETAKLLGESLTGNLTRNFYNALNRSDRIYLDKMEQFLPEDRVEARVRGADGIFKPITQGSIGQRSTAILSLLLSAGEQPLIIDQPEDDLDNQYIYDVVVNLLRKRKFSRQIIIATHNANIPVNGDAELIVALGVENRLGQLLGHGSIDRSDIKDQVSRIMEGSAEAFWLRKERYGY